jgi:hypothetical protein
LVSKSRSGRHVWCGSASCSTGVLLTTVALEKDFEGYRPIFEAVSESLELG